MNEQVVSQLVAVYSWKVDKKSEAELRKSQQAVVKSFARVMETFNRATAAMKAAQTRYAKATGKTMAAMAQLNRQMAGEQRSLGTVLARSARQFQSASRSIRNSTRSSVASIKTQAQVGAAAMQRMNYGAARTSQYVNAALAKSSVLANRLGKSLKAIDRATGFRAVTEGDEGFPRQAWMVKRGAGALNRAVDPLRTFNRTAFGLMAGGVGMVGRSWFQSAREMEEVKAKLRFVTGSPEAANEALKFVAGFAPNSPSTILEIADAYAKLVGAGIDPTIERMKALNEVASAAQVPLDALVEAAKNTAIGLPKVLEHQIGAFGYQISTQRSNNKKAGLMQGDILVQQGDNPPEKIGRTITDVINWLVEKGQTRFTGASAEMMKSLPGLISNVADSMALLYNAVSDKGALKSFMDMLDKFRAIILKDTGVSEGIAKVLKTVFDAMGRGIDYVGSHPGEVARFFDDLANAVTNIVDSITKALSMLNTVKPVVEWALAHLPQLWLTTLGASFLSWAANMVFGYQVLKAGLTAGAAASAAKTAAAAAAASEAEFGWLSGMGVTVPAAGAGAGAAAGAAGIGAAGTAAIAGASLFTIGTLVASVHELWAALSGNEGSSWLGDWRTGMDPNRRRLADGRILQFDPSQANGMTMDQWMSSVGMRPDGSPINNSSSTVNIRVGDINVTAPEGSDPEDHARRVREVIYSELEQGALDMIDRQNSQGQ